MTSITLTPGSRSTENLGASLCCLSRIIVTRSCIFFQMQSTSIPHSRASETRARENHPTREKASLSLPRLAFLAWGDFQARRVSHALLSLRKNGGLLVVYFKCIFYPCLILLL